MASKETSQELDAGRSEKKLWLIKVGKVNRQSICTSPQISKLCLAHRCPLLWPRGGLQHVTQLWLVLHKWALSWGESG